MQTPDDRHPSAIRPPRSSAGRLVRDTLFAALAAAAAPAAYLAARESPALATPLVLMLSIAGAMHARLAAGRWRTAAQVLAGAWLLSLSGAPPGLVWTMIAGGLAGAELAAPCTRRGAVLTAGALAGAAAALVSLLAGLMRAPLPPATVLTEAAGAAAGGALAGAVVLVLGPLAEWAFGHTTRLALGEWLSYDHPLLRELSLRAPGTFQHSVNVSMLADAASAAIGRDALLARVGALYHDVGKLRAPEYFVENQHGANPHDQLDPWTSAAILRAHVSDGVELVRAHRMGARVAAFVREHHGTGVMRLLEEKAASAGADLSAAGETYRYAGPAPRSAETGLVMIADQLDATARADAPDDEAACEAIVARTIDRIVREGELARSTLGADDLRAIRPALARVVIAMYHHRLPYPPSPPPADAAPGHRRRPAIAQLLSRRRPHARRGPTPPAT